MADRIRNGMIRVGADMVAESSFSSIDGPPDEDLSERIAPPVGKSAAEIRAEIAAESLREGEFFTPGESATEASRFSLGEMLTAVTIISLGMAGVRWLPPTIYAGIVGFAMFGWLIALSLSNTQSRLARLIWWSLLAVYLLSLVIGFVTVLKGK
jgi:hypothetical protein